MTAEKRVSGRIPAFANIIPLWTVPLWTCNWEGIWLVSIHKWPFATISTSIFGISCAAYVKYASAQSLDFLDLAANCSFMNWKLQLAPSGVSGWTLTTNCKPTERIPNHHYFSCTKILSKRLIETVQNFSNQINPIVTAPCSGFPLSRE
jgi:hypothetical protein